MNKSVYCCFCKHHKYKGNIFTGSCYCDVDSDSHIYTPSVFSNDGCIRNPVKCDKYEDA